MALSSLRFTLIGHSYLQTHSWSKSNHIDSESSRLTYTAGGSVGPERCGIFSGDNTRHVKPPPFRSRAEYDHRGGVIGTNPRSEGIWAPLKGSECEKKNMFNWTPETLCYCTALVLLRKRFASERFRVALICFLRVPTLLVFFPEHLVLSLCGPRKTLAFGRAPPIQLKNKKAISSWLCRFF